ncbi:glycoside hydrolase family 13 protein [Flavobacteriaceae bacterium GF1]
MYHSFNLFYRSRQLACLVFLSLSCLVQSQIERVEPPNWWVGFEQDTLQLLVKGKEIGTHVPFIQKEGIRLIRASKGDSPNYLFLDLVIARDAEAGTFDIEFKPKKGKAYSFSYELGQRVQKPQDFGGFDSSDAIYLITPDRFANGDPKNDVVRGMRETEVDRNEDYGRHGGDIRGIIDHLDYIGDMGFTAIWSCPLLTNDMPRSSYHGYAITDFYQVDPRFGTMEEYIELSNKAADMGIKLIMDQVANHCGSKHWWMDDLPFGDWLNFQEDYEQGLPLKTSNHKRTVNQDAYAADYDRNLMSGGWFVSAMPDLNQRNPFMAKYIIQNSIWWIETLKLGGIRQDTYPYPDKNFMAQWAKDIMREYPNFNIVGEEWSDNPLLVGYWQDGAKNRDGYRSYLPTTMDFPIQTTFAAAFKESEKEWGKGLVKLYTALANDFHYANPSSIMLFGDNHDMDRVHTQMNEEVALTQMAMAFVLTAPRIPQVYYGTEILMQNSAKPGDHGLIRTDFPGGWTGDTVNAFSGEGLTEDQKGMQDFMKKLLNFRKTSSAIHSGNTKHFAPYDGVYALFRYDADQITMLILNKNNGPIALDLNRFAEMDIAGKTFTNVVTGTSQTLGAVMQMNGKGATVLVHQKR